MTTINAKNFCANLITHWDCISGKGPTEKLAIEDCLEQCRDYIEINHHAQTALKENADSKFTAELTHHCNAQSTGKTKQEAIENYLNQIRQLLENPKDIVLATIELGEDSCIGTDEDEEIAIEKCLKQIIEKLSLRVKISDNREVSKEMFEEMPKNIPEDMGLIVIQEGVFDEGWYPTSTRYFAMKYGEHEIEDRLVINCDTELNFYRVSSDDRLRLPEESMEYVNGNWIPFNVAR